jgi:ABC-type transporter Mla maintaining outer membrane lipid asymmetry ATPase subunit MlaF
MYTETATQDSMLFDGLTVWETVYYAACLRLQHTMTSEDKRQAATETIRQLGLERCQNVQIGGKKKKGISGGEKKRTSIATELVAKPSVLVLDEPTSGLDANIVRNLKAIRQLTLTRLSFPASYPQALRVVQTITELARNQPLCCVLTVHQPGSRIFQVRSLHRFLSISCS